MILSLDSLLSKLKRKNDLSRLLSLIEDICYDSGWSLEELSGEMNFSTQYHRNGKGNYRVKFPPHVRFIDLGQGLNRNSHGFTFAIGQKRTDMDPQSGKVKGYWAAGSKRKRDTDDVTAFAIYTYLDDRRLFVDVIQSVKIWAGYLSEVQEELQSRQFSQQEVERRMQHGTPWAYADRFLLFGSLAVWFARNLSHIPIVFREGYPYQTYDRVMKYTMDHVDLKGLKLETAPIPGLGYL